jgi:MFS transporter, DHA1 family, staphyloferrin A biosynthesis exporter
LILELTDSPLWLGVINAGTSPPLLLLSLYAGMMADRLDKRSILIVAQSVAFAQALTLGILTHALVTLIGAPLTLASGATLLFAMLIAFLCRSRRLREVF